MLADYSRERSFTIGGTTINPSTWRRWHLRIGGCCRWFCGSPVWPGGPETVELRRRYAEIEATYEGIITLEANGRGIDDYFTKSHVLGEGGFGTVWQATPTKRAVKALPALRMGQGYALKRVRLPLRDAEIEMISKSLLGVSTGRMLQFLKVIASPEATEEHVTRNLLRILEIPHTMHIAMELLEGPTLRDWLVQLENKPLPETLASELAKQMLKAVHFLHRSAGALHRDVKPQNFGFARPVVQDQPPTLQLFDMGMVHVLPEPVVEASARELYALGMGGTMHWIPPVRLASEGMDHPGLSGPERTP
ncbi:Calcium-dependent protein kinase 25 [Durusdinium trenchii]|uniref:Calcium-dependent protein kinase 25 n=1 Tax=Durusdinium trenchii TaxID=1381693 RepID=A0ABP0IXE3_9DINO